MTSPSTARPGRRIVADVPPAGPRPSARDALTVLLCLLAAVLLASPIPFEQEAPLIWVRTVAAPLVWLAALGIAVCAVARLAPGEDRRATWPMTAVGLASVALHHGAVRLGMWYGPSEIGMPGWRSAAFLAAAAGAAWLAGMVLERLGRPTRAGAFAVWGAMIAAGFALAGAVLGIDALLTGWSIPGLLYFAPFCGLVVVSFLSGALHRAPHSSITPP